jgi:DNA-binding CsgD family transcriptional regulator
MDHDVVSKPLKYVEMDSKIFAEIKYYLPDFILPKDFPVKAGDKPQSFYFASCTADEFLYMDESFHLVTGHPVKYILQKGIGWWFSIIHPEDIKQVLQIIFKHCFFLSVDERLNKPFTLEYRIKSASGQWIWLQETKSVIAVTPEGKNHLVMGRLTEINEDQLEMSRKLNKIIDEDGHTNTLLRAALPIIRDEAKKRSVFATLEQQFTQPDGMVMPTKREMQILHLIGEGYSTKLIADKLHISINTVETHRRHLLEKIQVKNSMELIKQTSNAYWLKAM